MKMHCWDHFDIYGLLCLLLLMVDEKEVDLLEKVEVELMCPADEQEVGIPSTAHISYNID
jgi:hypothetical protein